ncbi:hypothetical protein ABZ071_34745, partial [Micromonospora fulviviridis]
ACAASRVAIVFWSSRSSVVTGSRTPGSRHWCAAQSVGLAGRLLAAGHPAHLWLTHGGHALDLARPDIRAVTAAFLDTVLPPA